MQVASERTKRLMKAYCPSIGNKLSMIGREGPSLAATGYLVGLL